MKKIAIIAVIAAIVAFFESGGRAVTAADEPQTETYDFSAFRDGSYYRVARAWESEHEPAAMDTPLYFPAAEGEVNIAKGESKAFTVTAPTAGLYQLGLSFKPEDDFNAAPTISVAINGEVPFNEVESLPLEVEWEIVPRSEEDKYNRYGNELLPYSRARDGWYVKYLSDANGRFVEPYWFLLDAGENEIAITAGADITIAGFYLASFAGRETYAEYIARHPDAGEPKMITISAEAFSAKNDIEAKAGYYKSADIVPSAYKAKILNILDGNSVSRGGTKVTYRFTVEEAGLYKLTLKYLQNMQDGIASARSFYIDGEIPYQELAGYLFKTTKKWTNHTLNKDDKPLLVYLEAGEHELTIATTIAPYQDYIERLYTVMDRINGLGLLITSITGASKNRYAEWDILKYLPDLAADLNAYAEEVEEVAQAIASMNEMKKAAGEASSLKIASKQLRRLARRPDKIHLKLEELSVGSGSAYQLIGTAAGNLLFQPLSVDEMYFSAPEAKVPKAGKGFFARFWFSVKSFFYSFFDKRYSYRPTTDEDELDVWVAQSPLYIDIIQNMIDDDFTEKTGIKARVNILPSSQKIILNNATGTNPDVILGIDSWEPYNYALRGLLVDLSEFPDFDEVTKEIYANCFTPVIYSDGVYAIPETQGLNLVFYRRDIFEYLNLTPPSTWEDVTALLPILQSHQMNFYHPLGSESSYKGFAATSPFIYAFGGEIFSENGYTETFSNPENIEAIRFMTDLFNIYNLPLQVANFFEHFRCGTMPIGISTIAMYLQLKYAAPELAGQWDIIPVPGFDRDGDGEVERWTTAYGKASILLASSKKQQAGWELIKWWNKTETQIAYTQNIKMTLGERYLIIPANVEALLASPWDEEIKTEVARAAKWARIPAVVPGSYVVERELSNIWNRVVIDRMNVRVAVGESVDKINRELARKFEEFGYLKDGIMVKEYIVPNDANIGRWVKGRDYDE